MSRTVRTLTDSERLQGLGGTDVAALVGVSTYRAPIDVYLEKTGEAPPQEQTWRMRLGQLFEDAIADAYAEKTGRRLQRMGVVFHKRHPFLYVHPDRRVVGEPGLVECKKTAWAFGDEPPVGYRVQAQWQMALTGRLWCDLASFAGQDIDIHRVERDQDLIDSLIDAAVAFWTDNIQAGVPPQVDGTDAYRRYLAGLHEPFEEERVATAEQVLMLDQLKAIGDEIKDATERQQLIKNRLAEQMGSAARLIAPQASVTYRAQQGRIDWHVVASHYRSMVTGVPPEALDEIEQRHRGNDSRVLRVNWKKEG